MNSFIYLLTIFELNNRYKKDTILLQNLYSSLLLIIIIISHIK